MKVAIYSRKSKYTGKGESIDNQIEMCKNYAEKHFDNIDEYMIYEDEGFSGSNTDRPEFQRLLKDAKKKKFNVLICYRLDRISRNVSDFSGTIEELNDYNIDFVSIKEQFDTSTPMGRAMMYIASVFAQLERETIAERIKDNMRQLARTGRWLGGRAPLGFKPKAIEYYDNEMNKRKTYKLTPIEKELDIVKNLFKKYIEFNSLSKLEGWTFKNNLKTKSGKNFDVSTINFILRNPVYCIADPLAYEYFIDLDSDVAGDIKDFDGKHGLMVFNKYDVRKKGTTRKDESKWIVAVGRHKGIIPSSEWIQVQNMLETNSVKAPRKGTGKYGLLSGIIRCKDCGSPMRVRKYTKPYGTYLYYNCLLKERSRMTQCNIKNLNGNKADALVVEKLKNMAMNDSFLMKNLEVKKKSIEKTTNIGIDKKIQLENKIKEYEKSIKNLTLQLAENEESIASKYIIEQIEELDEKIRNIKKEIYSVEEETESSLLKQNNIEILKDTLSYFNDHVDNLEFEEKRNLLRRIVKEITWDGENLKIKMYGQD